MIRGVNKNIIEILNTENQYFDKVILFVNNNHKENDSAFLNKKANEYLRTVTISKGGKSTAVKTALAPISIAKLSGAAIAGAAIAGVVISVL